MKKIGILLIASALVLSACGKRSEESAATQGPTGFNAQGEPIGGTGTEEPGLGSAIGQELTVRVTTDTPSVEAGTDAITTFTASVTDSNNLPVVEMPIAFSSTGGQFKSAQSITNENGEAVAELSVRGHAANQDIFVKAVAGNFDGSARVVAEGSTLEVSGDETVVPGNDVTIQATLTAGDGKTPLSNEIVNISSSAGNTLSTTAGLTDPQGQVEVVVGSANGGDTITFSALPDAAGTATVSKQHAFSVSDDQLKFADDASTELRVNAQHSFVVNWSLNGTPISGQALSFTITAGQIVGPSVINTDGAGNAEVKVLSSIAGEVTLYVEATDGSVINKHVFNFVGDTPANIELATTSSRVNTRDKANIVANVRDANGNPVKNTMVVFSSANLKGGQLSSTTSETNTSGEAEVTFTAGNNATEADEIIIVAEVAGTSINSVVNLTVVEPVLNVTIGTSNELKDHGEETQYAMTYVVQVADGGGQALSDATVQLSIEPVTYWKGRLALLDDFGLLPSDYSNVPGWSIDQWVADHWGKHPDTTEECESEDTNGNRILDAGEDINGNGSLDPQDPALLIPTETEGLATLEGNGLLTTDTTGSGYFRVVYPVTNAWWSNVRVVARAQALGVESTDSIVLRMPVAADEVVGTNPNPANLYSPYGNEQDCTDPG